MLLRRDHPLNMTSNLNSLYKLIMCPWQHTSFHDTSTVNREDFGIQELCNFHALPYFHALPFGSLK